MTQNKKSIHEMAISLAKNYHSIEAELLDVLEKIKDQKIYLELGFDGLFSYCVEALHLSESKAWAFSSLLKKSKLVPEIKKEIQSGGLTLSKASRIVSVITPQNKNEWIEKAKTLPKKELEREVAKVNPESIQRVKVQTLSDEFVRLHLNLSHEVFQNLKKLQTLLSKKEKKPITLEQTIEKMSSICLDKLDPVKKAERAQSRETKKSATEILLEQDLVAKPSGTVTVEKRIPLSAALKHQLNLRDQGKCQYQSSLTKRKCLNHHFTEFHRTEEILALIT